MVPRVLAAVIENQSNKFTPHENFVQRVLAASASTTSIVFCVVAMYFFLAIDPRRLVFRHQLILFLLSFDLLKGVVLLLYPAIVLGRSETYYNNNFCHVVGFFTALAIEGADLAILSFSIHTFLIVFQPQLTVKVKDSMHTEGGLYKFRYYVYGLSILIPLVLASLAFVQSSGYSSYVCWCYLPQRPVWYRLVLSWVPRYVIVVLILTIYFYIYIHVIREFKSLSGVFTGIHKTSQTQRSGSANVSIRPSFFSALKYSLKKVRQQLFPNMTILSPPESLKKNNENSASSSSSSNEIDDNDDAYEPDLRVTNLENFRKRQKIIQKQMKSIFVYPFAYIFVWLFPFILYTTQINYEEKHSPIYWLNCMGAFMQPLNGFVDTLVFLYREQPWEHTIMKNFQRENAMALDHHIHQTRRGSHSSSIPRYSFSNSFAVDMNKYSSWRRWLNYFKLPFFTLPTVENVESFQKKMRAKKERLLEQACETKIGLGHDFSNLLSGGIVEKDFRSAMDNYTLNFSGKRSSLARSSHTVGTSSDALRVDMSTTSTKSRIQSFVDPNDSSRISEGVESNFSSDKRKRSSNQASNRRNLSTPVPVKHNSIQTKASGSIGDNAELDFLEFLRNGA